MEAKMTSLEIIKKIHKRLNEADYLKIIEAWNYIFPKEEHLKEETFSKANQENLHLVLEEVRMMILDELKTKSKVKDILNVYNVFYKKKISIEDIL